MKPPNDWDFLIGSWHVHHRRLRERLAGCEEWIEFDGSCVSQKVLGGAGNVDDNVLDLPGDPYRAVTLRAYDPLTKTWSIWWLDSRSPGHLDPPVVGRFENGTGLFFADHTFHGRPIRVRFRWTNTDSGSPRWEQAFSDDGGKTWEVNWTMDFAKSEKNLPTDSPVVELRQYTLKSGERDTLIELFEREFVESQEAVGMRIIGTFRDLDNPDRFVWLRGFEDMQSRAAQLQQFYGGPVWKRNRDAANATMIDSDNVLLLRPSTPGSGFSVASATRPAPNAIEEPAGIIISTIYHLKESGSDFAGFFKDSIAPGIADVGIPILASFITEHHPNTFPALPVRQDANVFIWFSRCSDREKFEQHIENFSSVLSGRIEGEAEVLFLAPTARSLVR